MSAAVEPAAVDEPLPDRRGLRRVGRPKLAERLAHQAAEAADLRALATNPDVVALRVERIRRQVDVMAWSGIVLGLGFTMVNVQTFAARGAAAWSLPWASAWLLDPMVSLFVIALLRTQQVCARWQVRPGPWVRRGVWAGLAATYAMNTWTAWVEGVPSLVLLHSVPVVVVAMGAEALTDAREALTQAILVAARDGGDSDGQPAPVSRPVAVCLRPPARRPLTSPAGGVSPGQPAEPGGLTPPAVPSSSARPATGGPCSVYRLRAGDGALLYIGATALVADRLMKHRRLQDWWPEVVSVDVETFRSKADALVMEARAIRDELPAYNVQPGREALLAADAPCADRVARWSSSIDDALNAPVPAPSSPEYEAKDQQVRDWVSTYAATKGRAPGRDSVKREHGVGTSRAERLIREALACEAPAEPLASTNGVHR